MDRKESVQFMVWLAVTAVLVLVLVLNLDDKEPSWAQSTVPTSTSTPTPIVAPPTNTPLPPTPTYTPVPPTPTYTPVAPTPTNTPLPPTPTPSNLLPFVAVDQAEITVDEGSLAVNSGTAGDPDGDEVVLAASIGSVTGNLDGTWQWADYTSDGPSQGQTVTIWAIDDFGGQASATFDLSVVNVAPVVGPLLGPAEPVSVNDQLLFTVVFTDPGALDTHYAVIAWDDGSACSTATALNCTLTEGIPAGSVEGSHTYSAPGIYAVQLTVIDKDGGTGTSSPESVVVYDPSGGFVTGSGWIDSPRGAYVPDPSLGGRATFGFVSQYKKGASSPVGNAEFQFKAGDLSFHSDAYDWLVVNQGGTNAQFKGSGTINGGWAPNGDAFKFMLWAKDLDPDGQDGFRIRIWYEAGSGEAVVYDNGFEHGFEQPIGGGNIVIHESKGK